MIVGNGMGKINIAFGVRGPYHSNVLYHFRKLYFFICGDELITGLLDRARVISDQFQQSIPSLLFYIAYRKGVVDIVKDQGKAIDGMELYFDLCEYLDTIGEKLPGRSFEFPDGPRSIFPGHPSNLRNRVTNAFGLFDQLKIMPVLIGVKLMARYLCDHPVKLRTER